tara:strand:- start:237 stop:464 length:228 start_codon:yes stop_codon:yes gene_type:complete
MRRGNEWEWMYPDTKFKKSKKSKDLRYPDPDKHQIVSFIKSGIRILGYGLLPFNLVASVIFLILSEIIGIYEELV